MILIVAAMQEEVKYIKQFNHKDIDLLITGIGKVSAASHLSKYLSLNHVDAIVNLGFAGGSQSYQIKDIVMIDSARYHDFDLTFFGYKKGQVPGYPESFISNKQLMADVRKNLNNDLIGDLYTGDYFMTESKEGSFVVDMEGAALYQVAYQYQVPIISIKVISDILGMKDHHAHYKKFEADEGANLILEIYDKLFGGKNHEGIACFKP